MKLLLLISIVALFLSGCALAEGTTQTVVTAQSSQVLTLEQALQTVQRVPNFTPLVAALEKSGDELEFDKAILSPSTQASGSIYKTLVIKNKSGSEVVEASFGRSTLSELVLISLPSTVVNILKGTVQKFDVQERSLVSEGKWRGTDSLKDLTEIAPSTKSK